MRILLLIHTAIQLAIGLIMLIGPVLMMPELATAGQGQAIATSLARAYGFAALAMGILSGLMASRPIDADSLYAGTGALAAFHLGLTITHLLNVFVGLTSLPVVILHGVLTIIFLAIFLWYARR